MGKPQIHKRLSGGQVKVILDKYLTRELSAKEAMRYLGIGRTRLFHLAKEYVADKKHFSLSYERSKPTRTLAVAIEKNIMKELKLEKIKIIDNPNVPVTRYNYSYLQNLIKEKYDQSVSLNTIISRAKAEGFWKKKPPKKIHDREVITHYVGELIQHDSSHHLFAPDSGVKWYLITSLDDHSRGLLYANLFERESSWTHILAVESLVLRHGIPYAYYADQHSIFRYVKNRDTNSPWTNYTKFTDDVDPQWKQVLKELKIQPIYALSPQAKGKIERPYQWLQDHLVRNCVRNNVTTITAARKVLAYEVNQYNSHRVHSTTGEIPMVRFEKALRGNQSLFKKFELLPPQQSVKDIFCLRITRTIDAYRTVSIQNVKFIVPNGIPRQEVELRFHPDLVTGMTDVRFWMHGRCLGTQRLRNAYMPFVHF
jgi:hypothetical protein